ncbi:TIGR00266 family protein [Flammeovirga aprica]|uniref:TIGR00266 family protein n=1 Tax=Flammeovirga aprica JL-4 TaxID=694437 RepID=A0A7X9XB38_9BACT|nr:TIGR00266 family protein [Flammeovirga aprica]NME70332.1 TIGR00266 family protein [Flammeovirga aprica JL-4]
MNLDVKGKPAFAHVHVTIEPGESFVAESDAMSSMSAQLDMTAELNGGFFNAILKKVFGGETLFVNRFTNNTSEPLTLTITQPTPGDMEVKELNGESFCLQQGAYIASTPDLKLGVKWAGFGSWIGGEGLFKLMVSGHGKVIFGSFGGLIEREVNGEFIVDTSHLVGYEPGMKLKPQLSGGIFSSLFGGEGLVTRVEGSGKIFIQTRSLSGMTSWVNRNL